MGLMDSLAQLGLKDLKVDDLYANDEEEKASQVKRPAKVVKVQEEFKEEDFVYLKQFECPVCEHKYKDFVVKSGKARMIATDKDLRPIYEKIEPIKYETIMCPQCGYTSMSRYFGPLAPTQKKWIIEGLSGNVDTKKDPNATTLSYEEGIKRISLALASAIIKKAKDSEKAYICLKGGWLCRSYRLTLDENDPETEALAKSLIEEEKEFLENAYEGFVKARQSERFPIGGMDEPTLDYLLAVLALNRGDYAVSSKMIASLLQSPVTPERIKDKARTLKEELIVLIKKNSKASQ